MKNISFSDVSSRDQKLFEMSHRPFGWIIFLFFLIGLSACETAVPAEQGKHEAQMPVMGLHGKVKSMRMLNYIPAAKPYALERDNLQYQVYFRFDEEGHLKEMTEHGSEGEWIHTWIYTHDAKGNQIQMDGEEGRGSGRKIRFTYRYDEAGREVEKLYYSDGSELSFREIGVYDDRGNKQVLSRYDSEGLLSGRWVYKYDAQDREVEQLQYKGSDSLEYRHTCSYDQKGRKIETRGYNAFGEEVDRKEYRYTETGEPEEIRVSIGGEPYYRQLYKYDDKGNAVLEQRYDASGSLEEDYTFSYSYDSRKNWVKQISYVDSRPQFLIRRVIEYYE